MTSSPFIRRARFSRPLSITDAIYDDDASYYFSQQKPTFVVTIQRFERIIILFWVGFVKIYNYLLVCGYINIYVCTYMNLNKIEIRIFFTVKFSRVPLRRGSNISLLTLNRPQFYLIIRLFRNCTVCCEIMSFAN